MRPFNHINAKSLDEAIAALQKGDANVLAGGVDLLGTLKDNITPEYPKTVINLKTIPGLDYIKEEDGYIVDLTITDIGSDLLKMSLFMPTEQEAKQVQQHFLSDPLLTYKGVLALLTGDLQTVGELIPTNEDDFEL